MSNRYEREIEEILRNTHVDDERASVKDRIRAMNRRPPRRDQPQVRLGAEVWLITGSVLAFGAATVRWIMQFPDPTTNLIIGLVALAGFVMIAGTIVLSWIGAGRRPTPTWRGTVIEGGRGGGQHPFASARTRWNLMKLRLRYRRNR